jgi:hypothetical protein
MATPVSAAGDETMLVPPAPEAGDETVIVGGNPGPGDETVVLGAGAASGSATLPAYAAAAQPFPPPPPPPPPAPPTSPPAATSDSAPTSGAPGYAEHANPPGFAPLPAAVGAGGGPPSAGSFVAPQMAPPVYQPPKTVDPEAHSRRGPALIVALVCLVLIGAAGYLAVTRFHVLGRELPLTVSSASAIVDKSTGKCPSHTYIFTGKVKSNGAGGKLTYDWVKPDGTTSDNASATIPSGENESIFTLQFTFQGNGHTTGDAVLHVSSPSNIKSAPVHVDYVCP